MSNKVRIFTSFLILFVVGTFVFLKATEDTRRKNQEEASGEVSTETSDEVSKATSEESAEEASGEASIEVSDEASKETPLEPSEEPSTEVSEESSLAPSEEPSQEVSEEPSEESSEEASREASIEVSDESSEEVSEECPIDVPEGVDVGYIVYDITSDTITSCFNTNQDFRTGCTIKAAYVLWLLDSGTVTKKDMGTARIPYMATAEGTSVYRNKGITSGSMRPLSEVLEYCIKYSDNDAYCMLTSEYGYSEFNTYMEELGTSVKLGTKVEGYNFTNANAEEQLVIWKKILNFFEDGGYEAKKFKYWLERGSYNFFENAIPGLETTHMSGWAESSGTVNDCAIVLENGEPRQIVIILTSDGIAAEEINLQRFYEIAVNVFDTIIVL